MMRGNSDSGAAMVTVAAICSSHLPSNTTCICGEINTVDRGMIEKRWLGCFMLLTISERGSNWVGCVVQNGDGFAIARNIHTNYNIIKYLFAIHFNVLSPTPSYFHCNIMQKSTKSVSIVCINYTHDATNSYHTL